MIGSKIAIYDCSMITLVFDFSKDFVASAIYFSKQVHGHNFEIVKLRVTSSYLA